MFNFKLFEKFEAMPAPTFFFEKFEAVPMSTFYALEKQILQPTRQLKSLASKVSTSSRKFVSTKKAA